jgi:hypothetical protein
MSKVVSILTCCIALNIAILAGKEPIWRNKPCILQTPTEKLIGWSSYRQQLIYNDYRQYRCF